MKALFVAITLTIVALLAPVVNARADGGAITVSVSPAPLRAAPGETVQIPLRVSNNDPTHTIHFTITQRALALGDNGEISVLATPDPSFAQLGLPAGEQTLGPAAYRDYSFALKVPQLAPDMYLIGMLVSVRTEATGSVVVQGQVATFATLDIPGARDRRVQVALQMPGFHLGSSVTGQAVFANVGGSSFNVWGEVSSGGSQPTRLASTFLAAGRQRVVQVKASSRWGLGREHVTLDVYHNITDSQTGVDRVTATVWLVHPAYIAEAITLLIAGTLALIEWLRRRFGGRRHRRPLPAEWRRDDDLANAA